MSGFNKKGYTIPVVVVRAGVNRTKLRIRLLWCPACNRDHHVLHEAYNKRLQTFTDSSPGVFDLGVQFYCDTERVLIDVDVRLRLVKPHELTDEVTKLSLP